MALIDLGAPLREKYPDNPDGLPVRDRHGADYLLPLELPIDVFDPLLDPSLDLSGLIRDALASETEDTTEAVIDIFVNRPDLPTNLVAAFHACFTALFGEDQYATFRAGRPGVTSYATLVRALTKEYGVSLGEAFGSRAPSENDGTSSKETSPATSDKTPATSSDDQDNAPVSSESDAPAT